MSRYRQRSYRHGSFGGDRDAPCGALLGAVDAETTVPASGGVVLHRWALLKPRR
jgi:hypothetical protein